MSELLDIYPALHSTFTLCLSLEFCSIANSEYAIRFFFMHFLSPELFL